MSGPLVELRGLGRSFAARTRHGPRVLWAVRDVDLTIARGETLGLVGESGCGKTTLGRCLLRLLPPTCGRVVFDGADITTASPSELKPLRRRMQLLFQDPLAALNPRLRVGAALREPLLVHRKVAKDAVEERLRALAAAVGLGPEILRRYPHELSGGERQRVVIARALSVEPELLVADEPVSALDVSVQAQVLNLLMDLKRDLRLTYLFISHDLRVVRYISDQIAVMLLGRLVEVGPAAALSSAPAHPYTEALFRAAQGAVGGDPKVSEVCTTRMPIAGCPFHPRCPKAVDTCRRIGPELEGKRDGRKVACHRA